MRARASLVRAGVGTGERVPLSAFDRLTGHVYTPRVLFYERTLDGASLAASLARTLRRFPVLAGRMRRDAGGGLHVACDDAGVRFVEAHAAGPMPAYGVDHPAHRDVSRFVENQVPFGIEDRDTPLLTVKLTHLAGGGSVLGVCIHHALVDGTSYMDLLSSWSREHLGLPQPDPCHDRALLDAVGTRAAPGERSGDQRFVVLGRLEVLRFYARIARASLGLVTQVFRLSAGEVRRMKEAASADLEGTGEWVSRNDAITAHLWKSLAELRGRGDRDGESLGLIASVRDRLAPEIPPHYFGNCASHATPTMTAGDLRSSSLGRVAREVRRGLEGLSPALLRGDLAFLTSPEARRPGGRVFPRMMLDVFDACTVFNNWSKLPFYSIDLGGGAPFWYEFPAVPIPWLTLVAPTPPGDGGRDVRLSVPADKLGAFHSRAWQAVLHRYEREGA